MPKEKTAQCSKAPPAKILNSAATPPELDLAISDWNHSLRTCALTPGIVMAAPARTITNMPRVNRIRCRSSGILKMLEKAEIMRRDRSGRGDGRTASLLDTLAGRRAELVGLNRKTLRQNAATQDLDAIKPAVNQTP